MTEEIIIDGINVAGCEFYFKDKKYSCDLSFINQEELCKCDDVQDCTYKQLKQAENTVNECHKYLAELEDKIESLEQERDELKKTVENQKLEYEELQCDLSEVENACGCYQSENAELEQENKELKELNKKICEDWEKEIKVYWAALEEIREIAISAFAKQRPYKEDFAEIENIINKVLNKG